ncbi:LPS assembly protein LptD [uncultured Endozoicomonas sp.]|uniref:LPS-assembly protein LptD n=1 Tax=uncultured Endozoicomonas sp. TaxID=432652 RepID=UPI002605C947|nr:LPS assembly protein LptD [uncultured Endozoicomonas sp.]
MDMHYLPFTPKTLTLAVAASMLASGAGAMESGASDWRCQTLANGQWLCAPGDGSAPLKSMSGYKTKAVVAARAPAESQQVAVEVVPAVSGQGYALKALLDWQPISQLSSEQKAKEPFYSCGAYIEPERPGKNFSGDNNQQPMLVESDESSYGQNDIANFKGNVVVRQGSRQFESETASLDRNTSYGQFEGNVRFRDKGVLLVGEKGDLNTETGRASLEDTAYVLHSQGSRGNATHLLRNEDDTMELTDATYTTCPPGDNGWLLSGSKVKLDMEEGQGVAKHAVLRIQRLPVLYTPWISFPIDDRRKTGFLYPTFSQGSDNGFDFSIPYYINMAPNFDATVTPRYMTKRGTMLENEFRYLLEGETLGRNEGELGVAGLLNKDELKDDNPYYDKQRWLLNYRHLANFTPRWQAEIDYAKASDKNYLDDFSTDLNLSANAPLNQRIGTRYLGGNIDHSWQLSVDAHQYQNMSRTSDDPYNKLPQVKLDGSWFAGDNFNLSYVADYTKFTRDKDWDYMREVVSNDSDHEYKESVYGQGYGIDRANGERLYLETGFSLPFERSYGFLRPSLKVQHVQYRLSNLIKTDVEDDLSKAYAGFDKTDDYSESPKTTVPVLSLDGGLYFDRMTTIGSTSFTHTLEPRIKYLYSPYEKGQEMNPVFDTALMGFNYSSLWRDTRFSGYDRLGDANQLSLGIATRFIEDDGFERFKFGLGQILYFEDRQLWINPLAGNRTNNPSDKDDWDTNLNDEGKRLWEEMHESTSSLATEMVYNITRKMSLRQDLMWDTNNNRMDNYGLYYQYKPSNRAVLNAGYRYLSQSDRYVKNSEDRLIPDAADPTGYQTTDNNLSITDLSFAMPISNKWSAMGRWQHDLTNSRNLELLSGVEYNSCCYQVRLFWRQWIDDDNNIDHPDYKKGIMLQFVLRGLGDLSGSGTKELLQGIKGYGDEK